MVQISSRSRVYHVTDYGADPTGNTDSSEAIRKAISDAFQHPSDHVLKAGIADLGGAEIHLDGGSYLISSAITLPATGGGNLKVHSQCISLVLFLNKLSIIQSNLYQRK